MLKYQDLNAEQLKAVAETLAEYLGAREVYDGLDGVDTVVNPILPGTIRVSRNGNSWAAFPGAPKHWFQLRDNVGAAQPPDRDGFQYEGFQIVLNPDGLPMGNSEGVLIMHKIRQFWLAQVVNTGWNYESEIIWMDIPAND